MDATIRRELRLLKIYSGSLTAALAILALAAFRAPSATNKAKFEEIDVERINVVEKDGTLRLTLSNQSRFPDPMFRGKAYGVRQDHTGMAGLVFFNEEGTENGGLVWHGARADKGVNAGATLNFDQFDQDNTVQLSYGEQNGHRGAGLTIVDRPEEPLKTTIDSVTLFKTLPDGPDKDARMRRLTELVSRGTARRLFAGKLADRSSTIVLSDSKGQARLRLVVDTLGTARIDFLNDSGRVTRTLSGTDTR